MSDPIITVAALLVTGYLLVAMELFVIPGFGLAGIAGFGCLAAGCLFSFRWYGALPGTFAVLGVLASTTAILVWFPRSRYGRSVIHEKSLAKAKAADAAVSVGEMGVAESDLRPAGIARFGELRQDVVTDGEFISAQAEVHVIEVGGSRVVVELADNDTLSEEGES